VDQLEQVIRCVLLLFFTVQCWTLIFSGLRGTLFPELFFLIFFLLLFITFDENYLMQEIFTIITFSIVLIFFYLSVIFFHSF
jgi:hypothetical protein